MKLLGKTEDRAAEGAVKGPIDSLLRAYVSRPTNRACSEFDVDLANAYIERSLTPAAQSRYEEHLSECTPCRKNVVALSRLAGPELRQSIPGQAESARRTQIFGLSSWPRWAMAAAAVMVIAISLPLLLTRKTDRTSQDTTLAVNASQPSDDSRASDELRQTNPTPAAKVPAASPVANSEPKPTDRARGDAVSSNGPASGQQATGGERAAGNDAAPKPAVAADQSQGASSAQPASDVVAGQAPAKQSETQGFERTRQQQPTKDADADAKANVNEQQETKKEDVARRAATVPPPAPPPVKTESPKEEKLKHSAGRLALRDSSSSEAARLTEKTINGKKFSLKNDTWTDEKFEPNKDLPIVTVVRGSNVYNELLTKKTGLKKYFDGIPPSERAIIVYKGTVYKLIPQ
jgi:hypothetical protein